jgi:hypothetical protein
MGFGTPPGLWVMGFCNVMGFNWEHGVWTAKIYGLLGLMGYEDYGLSGIRLYK